ncbi:polymer-forming cytoskeletal protein [Halorubrum amylolyticum]|uniref:polymer-forming cytoskeletal protein n=1 Tax=Halorubrum amylolyticum TaxID=2508724 RepID=UPI0010092BAF|nr:polymer-forming cytoskeletal protein [Halorubrum amylolyticum]
MSLRGGGPIEELAVPSGTTVEEHDLVTDGDVLVGGQSTVEFGLRGRNVALGERVSVENDIEAEGDCRLDTWCSVDGNVLVGEDAYLGERVTVTGRLMVSGDLDIGDDVTIEEGFEANGWIVIRNPVPTLVFYFIVLSQLLRLGETDAADDLAEALADGDDVRDPLLVPRGAEISDDAWRVSTPATVGDDCRLHGNLRAESIRVGERDEVFGSLRAREGITVGADTVIHGDVTTRGGTVTVEAGARVLGDVSAGDLVVHDGAEIDGSLRARGEMKLVQETGSDEGETGSDEGETGSDEGETGSDEGETGSDDGESGSEGERDDADGVGEPDTDEPSAEDRDAETATETEGETAADSGAEVADEDPDTEKPDADAEAT